MNKNVKINNPMKVITGPDTRWSYANVWEPKSINGGTSLAGRKMASINGTPVARKPRSGNLKSPRKMLITQP